MDMEGKRFLLYYTYRDSDGSFAAAMDIDKYLELFAAAAEEFPCPINYIITEPFYMSESDGSVRSVSFAIANEEDIVYEIEDNNSGVIVDWEATQKTNVSEPYLGYYSMYEYAGMKTTENNTYYAFTVTEKVARVEAGTEDHLFVYAEGGSACLRDSGVSTLDELTDEVMENAKIVEHQDAGNLEIVVNGTGVEVNNSDRDTYTIPLSSVCSPNQWDNGLRVSTTYLMLHTPNSSPVVLRDVSNAKWEVPDGLVILDGYLYLVDDAEFEAVRAAGSKTYTITAMEKDNGAPIGSDGTHTITVTIVDDLTN